MSERIMSERKICYIWDDKLIEECNRLPAVIDRASLVHQLIAAYELFGKLKVVRSSPATFDNLNAFHSVEYLEHLKTFSVVNEDYMATSKDEGFGIGYDCPPVSNMFELVSVLAGGSITAARSLVLGIADVAVNWCGGWHHAHSFGGEGFCYVNDIVLAIHKLISKFHKVLYVDLDVHHGNGVEYAFEKSKSVFTLSFHKYQAGFYPGTGGLDNIGSHEGAGYTCNFPLQDGYSDDTMEYIFPKVFAPVYQFFKPNAIVVQCGADALAKDPLGRANLTACSYLKCIQRVLAERKPTLLLGGGGYNHPNVARLWTRVTADLVGAELDEDIPEHIFWPQYGPSYTIDIEPSLVKDMNKKIDLDNIINKIEGNLERYLGDFSESVDRNIKSERECVNTVNPVKSYKILQSKNIAIEKMTSNQNKIEICNTNKDVYEFEE